MQQARADFIHDTELTIMEQSTPNMPGYRTFSFFVLPPDDHTIRSIDARFTATVIGQVDAPNTLFVSDFNTSTNTGGADEREDSHFAFDRTAVNILLFSLDEDDELQGTFSLNTPISDDVTETKIAHVVLQDGIVGTAVISFAVQDSVDTDEHMASFNVQFGGAAVPEPSSLAMLLVLGGPAVIAIRRRRRCPASNFQP